MDNYSEEEDDSFSSEQEGSDDAVPSQVVEYSQFSNACGFSRYCCDMDSEKI